jgi:hypothetical protein
VGATGIQIEEKEEEEEAPYLHSFLTNILRHS